ncbi:MAG: Fe-S cluster assembly ATPase SufC [Candidatus Micrarchaeaceae archaeon]
MKLEIDKLFASLNGKEILHGISLTVKEKEMHVIMGPNGSGKTTLAKAIFGYPGISINKGDIRIDGKSILDLQTNERAKKGLFLGFQNPVEIEGVGLISFLASIEKAFHGNVDMKSFIKDINSYASYLGIEGVIGRNLNVGFSGGEKKKIEVLQMMVQKPKIAVLDEPDSGLDIDATKIVADAINKVAEQYDTGVVIITHYKRILDYIKRKTVHILIDGKIVKEGDESIIEDIEKEGYEKFKERQ